MVDIKISLYSIFILISFVGGLFVLYKNTKLIKLRNDELLPLLLCIVLGIIFGAKYFTFLTNFQKYKDSFDFFKIGFSSYGAVIGIIGVLVVFSKLYKKSFKELIYISLPSIPLMYGIGKIGCFFCRVLSWYRI